MSHKKINAIFEFSGPFYPRIVIFVGKREILNFHSFPPCSTKTGMQNGKELSIKYAHMMA